jgi:diguanylate cyclase (GGDEF)-like protein
LVGWVLLVALVPAVALQLLIIGQVRKRTDDAALAHRLVDRVEFLGLVGAVQLPAAIERTGSEGVARIDQAGLSRDLVKQYLGFDFDPVIDGARLNHDAALDRLLARFGSVDTGGGTLADRAAGARAGLATERAAIDRAAAQPEQVTAAFDALSRTLDEAVRTFTVPGTNRNQHLVRIADQNERLLGVLTAVASETQTISRLMTSDAGLEAGGSFELAEAAGAADAAVDGYLQSLAPADAEAFRELLGSEVVERQQAYRMRSYLFLTSIDASAPAATSADLRLAFDAIWSNVDKLLAFQAYALERFGEQSARAQALGGTAEAARVRWLVAAAATVMFTMVLLALAARVLVSPLRRLTSRAERLARGDVDTSPMPVRGPREVRAMAISFNGLLAMMQGLADHLRLLASGSTGTGAAVAQLPGSLGASVEASMHRLADTTEQLRGSEAMARAILDNAADAIWAVRADGVIESANEAAARLTGCAPAVQTGRSLSEVLGTPVDPCGLGGELVVHPHGASEPVYLEVSSSVVTVGGAELHTVFARDVSERHRYEARLSHQARHDPLTGLPNRFAAMERLSAEAARDARAGRVRGVLVVDLDAFKGINDMLGPDVGDEVLCEVAERLRGCVREGEYVARLGEDQFLVVADVGGVAQLRAIGERLQSVVQQPYTTDHDFFTLSTSVGMTLSTPTAADPVECVRNAEAALARAKARGRGEMEVYDARRDTEREPDPSIEAAVRRGLAHQEFELYIQPIVDAVTRRPWGGEVLLRWRRPGHGLVSPALFIPIAERSRLILDIERWVLDDACRLLATFGRDEHTRHLHLAVNVSGRHLVEPGFVDLIDRHIAEHGVDPSRLELELTETHLLHDVDRAAEVLAGLRERCIEVAVDDFGTGYSSMEYLRRLPLSTLKIDRSFVSRIADMGHDRTIIEALLQLGRAMHLDVVAEGVETAEQLIFLAESGCGRIQGYHIARPMPYADFLNWLTVHGQPAGAVPTAGG